MRGIFSCLLRLGGRAKRKSMAQRVRTGFFSSCLFSADPCTRHSTLAPSHLISLFARASTSGGIVRPI